MPKVSVELIHEVLSNNNVEPETIQAVLKQIEEQAAAEAEAEKANRDPVVKKQFVLIVSDPKGTLPAEDWVTGAASDDIDIAGNFVATDDGRLYQLQHGTGNGLVWQERYSPARGATVYGIHVDEDSAVWAVANDGRISRLIPPYQLDDHFSELYNDQSMFFFDIWGSSASNMYAVGVNGLVLRYHEVEVEGEMQMVWEPVELPDLPETKNLPTHLFDKFGRPVHR